MKTLYYIKIPFNAAPLPFVFLIVSNIVSGLLPTLTVYATAGFLDSALMIFDGNNEYASVYPWIIFIAGIIAFGWLQNQIDNFAQTRLGIKLRLFMNKKITDKIHNLEYMNLENSETWNLIERVSQEPEEKFLNGFLLIMGIIRIAIQILGYVFVVGMEIWWVAIIILLISIPLIILGYKTGKDTYELQKELSTLKRKNDYFSDILSTREYIAERKIFSYAKELTQVWYDDFEQLRKKQLKTNMRWLIKNRLVETLSYILFFGVIGILLYFTIFNMLTTGFFVASINSTYNIISVIANKINPIVEEYVFSLEYIKDYLDFFKLEEIEKAYLKDNKIVFEKLEFKDVSFTYPGSEKKALNHISFMINKNQHIAFVGANGSGKTTIVKLLIGLYTNYNGVILLNGIDLKLFSQTQRNKLFSVVFQDFAQYYISIKDNINLGADMNASDEEISALLEEVGLVDMIDKMSNGINTVLGRIEDNSIDLSGGQWQRIAIARSLAKNAPIMILDEPTAALDPVYESEIYKQFEKINAKKTTLLISHRLASTRMADKILVFDNGTIIEQGTHEELINNSGLYSKMFNSQKSWYVT